MRGVAFFHANVEDHAALAAASRRHARDEHAGNSIDARLGVFTGGQRIAYFGGQGGKNLLFGDFVSSVDFDQPDTWSDVDGPNRNRSAEGQEAEMSHNLV